MELDATRKGFALHKKPNQGNIGRSMNIGDLVRLTPDGVVAAWYPNINHDAVGIVIKEHSEVPAAHNDISYTPIEVHWPLGRDCHEVDHLEIIKKYF